MTLIRGSEAGGMGLGSQGLQDAIRSAKSQAAQSSESTQASQDQPGSILNDFGNILSEQINQINTLQQQADTSVQAYASGGDVSVHQMMLSIEKADMSMQLALQVRNKLVQAYQDLSHMQV